MCKKNRQYAENWLVFLITSPIKMVLKVVLSHVLGVHGTFHRSILLPKAYKIT